MTIRTKRSLIVISVLLLIVISIIYLIQPKSYIKLRVAPNNVNISIDKASKFPTNDKSSIAIKPGRHIITISKEDFRAQTKSVDIKEGQTTEVFIALEPISNQAANELNNTASQQVLERVSSDTMNTQVIELEKKYPVINILPIKTDQYGVYICKSKSFSTDNQKIALCAYETPAGDTTDEIFKSRVVNFIKDAGYNTDNYEIIWYPFEG